jgi:hypothetical protein
MGWTVNIAAEPWSGDCRNAPVAGLEGRAWAMIDILIATMIIILMFGAIGDLGDGG